MKIDLTSREVPPDMEQPGVFADVFEASWPDKKGRSHRHLVLTAQLAATKTSRERFTATRAWNIEDTRGVNQLLEDLKVWRGSDELPNLKDFDPEREFIGKGCLIKPFAVSRGGKRQIQFTEFKPATGQAITVSSDFVRANQSAD